MIVVLVSGGSTRALVFRVLPPSLPSFLFYFSKAVTALVILKCSLSKQSFQLSLSFLYNLSPYRPRGRGWDRHLMWENTHQQPWLSQEAEPKAGPSWTQLEV